MNPQRRDLRSRICSLIDVYDNFQFAEVPVEKVVADLCEAILDSDIDSIADARGVHDQLTIQREQLRATFDLAVEALEQADRAIEDVDALDDDSVVR